MLGRGEGWRGDGLRQRKKAKEGGRRWRRQERDVTDNFIEQGGRLDGGACQAEGAGCDLQEGRQEREVSDLSDELIHPFSLSG